MEGDADAGAVVRHRYLARRRPALPNLRQAHLIPAEICEDLRRAGFDVHPDELGENVTTASIELERLPLETLLSRGPTAVHRTDRCPDALRLDRSFPFRIEEAHD